MRLTDWRSEIVKGVTVHQRLAELDAGGLWQYHLPEVAASEDEIETTERELGYRLDARYREFLHFANGWRSFYQDVDILGTRNLLGDGLMQGARRQLAAVEPAMFLDDVGMAIGDVLPIAASDHQSDMFLLGLPWSREPGVVIWFAGYMVERFHSFDDFYLSMLDYNRRQIVKFEGHAQGGLTP
jgi:SMI1-KNR4 cell-wall